MDSLLLYLVTLVMIGIGFAAFALTCRVIVKVVKAALGK